METARKEDESQQGQTGTDFRVQGVTVDEMWVVVGAENGQMRWREGKVLGGKTLKREETMLEEGHPIDVRATEEGARM